ncbi:hypothetical protein DL93DRAFT_2085252, partial [Clavulina sp. PMI_390]
MKREVAQLNAKAELANLHGLSITSPTAPANPDVELVAPLDVATMLIPKLGMAYHKILRSTL